MGIRGLTKYLKSIDLPLEPIPEGSVLHIDGSGFCIDVLLQLLSWNSILGGLYNDFHSSVCKELDYLTTHFQIIIYQDGTTSAMKDFTIEKRIAERNEKWLNLLNLYLDHQDLKTNYELPFPRLFMEQFYSTCRLNKKITLIQCKGEADQDIAIAVLNANAHGVKQHYCYAQDSDFIAFRDVPFISLRSFTSTVPLQTVVYRRADISSRLGLTESQFLDWCLLQGNDYTVEFPKSELYTTCGVSISLEALHDAEASLAWVQTQSQPLTCSDSDIQAVIDFSRELYDLHDISDYPESYQDVLDIGSLSYENEEKVQEWSHDQLSTLQVREKLQSNNDTIGLLALEYLSLHQVEFHQLKDIHLQTIYKMIQSLLNNPVAATSATSFEHVNIHSLFQSVQWEDMEIAVLYQNICKILLHTIHEEFPTIQTPLPLFLYNGVIYVTLLSQLRQEELKQSSSLTSSFMNLHINQAVPSSTNIVVSSNSLFGGNPYKTNPSLALMNLVKGKTSATTVTSSSVSHEKTTVTQEVSEVTEFKIDVLPIDAHRDDILRRINKDRVVIIHGETGCGKSSRLPVMLLEHAAEEGRPFHLMASQPRRIAASSLMKRLRGTLGNKVGMRMGHGIKDEYEETTLFFVTTGYLVRLLAHHPEYFRKYTHLVVDEVHERSVDGDVLLYLCRRLLSVHPTIKIILMSATIHTELYRGYFSQGDEYFGDLDCLSVGVRRFPLNILYVEDIRLACQGKYNPPNPGTCNFNLPSGLIGPADSIDRGLKAGKISTEVYPTVVKDQYALAVGLIKSIGVNGTSVLVFVSGIADITELSEKFETLARYKVIAIHSDIPFEEQEAAFTPAAANEVKVILATNAAESSITLPDCDVVICLGTHKSLRYEATSHRVQLVNTWVSKASATQRAGRTGRVRPGTVFRLYNQAKFESFEEHEQSEVLRQPLQDVILKLKTMLEGSSQTAIRGIVPVLQDLIEPPDMSNVEKSFIVLYDAGMIASPDDYGALTETGKLAGSLPVDINLSRLIALGINMGVGLEACILAAAQSLPKTVFRVASPLIHTDSDEYNAIVRQAFLAATTIDAGVYSEPIMMLNLYLAYRDVNQDRKFKWAMELGIAHARLKLFSALVVHLVQRVNNGLPRGVNQLDMTHLQTVSKSTLNRLRLLLLWTCEGNIIHMKPVPVPGRASCDVTISGATVLHQDDVNKLLPPAVIEYSFRNNGRRIYDGRFAGIRRDSSLEDILTDLALVGATYEASTVWVHQKSMANDKGIMKASDLFVFAVYSGPHQNSTVDLIQSIFSSPQVEKMTQKASNDIEVLVILARSPTKKQITRVKDLHDQLLCSFSLLLSAADEDSPKLTANNCVLTDQVINFIFSGDKDFKGHLKVSEQVLASRQIISFKDIDMPKPQHDQPCDIYDFPVGYRLLNAYRLGYKDKTLRIKPAVEEAARVQARSLAVGSEAWLRERQEGTSTKKVNPSVGLSGMVGTWDTLGLNGPAIKAIIASNSHLAPTLHRGPELLFGVVHETLEIVTAGGKKLVFCRGVTLLPPGSKWIELGLRCVGKEFKLSKSTFLHEGAAVTGDDEEWGSPEDLLIMDIADLLSVLKDEPIEINEQLIASVDEVFGSYIDIIEGGGGVVMHPTPRSGGKKQKTPKKAPPGKDKKQLKQVVSAVQSVVTPTAKKASTVVKTVVNATPTLKSSAKKVSTVKPTQGKAATTKTTQGKGRQSRKGKGVYILDPNDFGDFPEDTSEGSFEEEELLGMDVTELEDFLAYSEEIEIEHNINSSAGKPSEQKQTKPSKTANPPTLKKVFLCPSCGDSFASQKAFSKHRASSGHTSGEAQELIVASGI